jgi:hypothetical protein
VSGPHLNTPSVTHVTGLSSTQNAHHVHAFAQLSRNQTDMRRCLIQRSQGDDSIQTCLTMSTGTVVGRHLHPILALHNKLLIKALMIYLRVLQANGRRNQESSSESF